MSEREILTAKDAKNLNILALAFVGDAVQTLYVRQKLVDEHDAKVDALHVLASEQVNCSAQAEKAERLLKSFNEEEKEIYMRGRNAKTTHLPKHGKLSEYHKATGLEAVFGYLYLTGQSERLLEFLGE